jgi:two-component system heavy metal sensor histidine kinase CusS
MSSKTGVKGWSIRVWLTLWFGAGACALAGAVAVANYWLLETHRYWETDEGLAAWAEYLHKARDSSPHSYSDSADYPVRVIGPDQPLWYESPTMAGLADASTFPEPATVGTNRTVGGKRYRLFSSRIDGWTYQLAYEQTANVNLFARHRRNLLLAIIPTVIVGLLGGYVLTWRGLRPLRAMTRTVQGIAPSHLGDRIPVATLPAELRVVADAFNGVMDRLQDAFTRLDQFAADVAHELRTPVHNLRGGIEVALGQDRAPDDYRLALVAALNEADRIGRLVDRLLLLVQAEDPRREVRRETGARRMPPVGVRRPT